jgi:hypothetical protein
MTEAGILLPRRTLLRGGLAGFAAAMMTRALPGCSDPAPAVTPGDAGTPDAGFPDVGASPVDAGTIEVDGGLSYFEPRAVPAPPALRSLIANVGPLGAPDANGLRLPPGFTSRVIARTGERVAGTSYSWHLLPDGGATFATEDGGWIYTSNSEMVLVGGVGAVRFAADGRIVGAYRILDRTRRSTARAARRRGARGCRARRSLAARCTSATRGASAPRWCARARGVQARGRRGRHRSTPTSTSPKTRPTGASTASCPRVVRRRATPTSPPACWRWPRWTASAVVWQPRARPAVDGRHPTRRQVEKSTVLRWRRGHLVPRRAWCTSPPRATTGVGLQRRGLDDLTVLYDAARHARCRRCAGSTTSPSPAAATCSWPKTAARCRWWPSCPRGSSSRLSRLWATTTRRCAGPAFDPSGTRLYFSSQRGLSTGSGSGWTFEITGPFHERMG